MSKLTGGIYMALSLAGMLVISALGLIIIRFIPDFALAVYPYLMALTGLGVALVIAMMPFTYFQKFRSGIASTTLAISYVIGFGFWAFAAIVAYKIWGMTGLVIGLVFAGVGVVPIAFLASIFTADWHDVLNLTVAAFLTFGLKGLSIYIMSKTLNTYTPLPATNANPPPKLRGNILEEMLRGAPLKPAEPTRVMPETSPVRQSKPNASPVIIMGDKPISEPPPSVIFLPYNPKTPVEQVQPESAINVNAAPKPAGSVLDEILYGPARNVLAANGLMPRSPVEAPPVADPENKMIGAAAEGEII